MSIIHILLNSYSTYNKPTYNKPTYNKPTYNKPTYNKPTYNKPTYNKPSGGSYNPSYNKPSYNSNKGWSSSGKPNYSGNPYSNKRYAGGSSSWSAGPKPSYSSLAKNPGYASASAGMKKKSMLSKIKTPLMVAGGAYLAYKVGKGVGMMSSPGFSMMSPMMGPYSYGPYYGGYGGYGGQSHYQPYHQSPTMFRGESYNRFAYDVQSCYECSSIDGSNPMCDDMDEKYSMTTLEGFRHSCPVKSICVVTVGRVFPDVEGPVPDISQNSTVDPEEFKKFEGKSFTRRSCQPVDRQDACENYCPTPINGLKTKDGCDIFMCNQCDTESCNSWGLLSMPDSRTYVEPNHSTPLAGSFALFVIVLTGLFF